MPSALVTRAESPKPPLKWAGGKRWQIPHLQRIWQAHAHRRLVEPFCGGLAVALGLRPARALLNDANPHLINFYRRVGQGLEIARPLKNDAQFFYAQRRLFNDLLREGRWNSIEGAELFYYLNRTGYNGLCRFNSRGEFNVPFGRYKTIRYMKTFAEYRDVFAAWEFTIGDFADVRLKKTDFVYADPPYDVEFTTYSQRKFRWDDQVRTAEVLAAHRGPVVLVNQATPRIETLYRRLGYDVQYLKAPRRISCSGDRTPAREILATRNL